MLGDVAGRRIYYLIELMKQNGAKAFVTQDDLTASVVRDNDDLADDVRVSQTFKRLEKRLYERHHLDLHPYYAAMPTIPKWPFWILCLLLGLGSNYLGSSTNVNLLRVPIAGLILWNMVVVLVTMTLSLFRRKPLGAPFSKRLHELWLKGISLGAADDKARLLKMGELSFRRRWLGLRGHRVSSRLAIWLNLGAILILLGAVIGMYGRGLSDAYAFVWASTFIEDEAQLRNILNLILGPVLLLSGNDLPPLSGENGAAWIHLLALAAAFYGVWPRLGLMMWHGALLKKSAKLSLDLQDPVFVGILSQYGSMEPNVSLYGYSYQLNEIRQERLLSLARQVWGERARLFESGHLDWGETEFDPQVSQKPPQIVLVCFNGAQTPEEEVHAEIARAMTLWQKSHPAIRVLALIDGESVAEDKKTSRREAWRDVLMQGNFRDAVFLANEDPAEDVRQLRAYLESEAV